MSRNDAPSFIKIVIFCIAVIIAVFYLNIIHSDHGTSPQETLATKFLTERIDSTRDYVEKLEHEIMKLAIEKKREFQSEAVDGDQNGHSHGLNERGVPAHVIDHGRSPIDLHLRPNPENPNQFLPGYLHEHQSQHQNEVTKKSEVNHHDSNLGSHGSTSVQDYNMLLHPSAQGRLPEIPEDVEKLDPDFYTWLEGIKEKFYCLEVTPQNIGYYHYHIRKAAGTTIRDVVKTSLSRFKKSPALKRKMLHPSTIHVDDYYETEGVVLLHPEILELKDLVSVISLREPVNRILSLYWYEHVGWYDGILKQPHRCKNMRSWVNAWLDGSDYKNTFVKKFPDNNYVEIENYYVKSLIGHVYKDNGSAGIHGNGEELTRDDLERAKAVLRKFDIIMITEWMGDDTQMDVLNAIFPGRTQISPGHKVKGDFRMKERLRPTLAVDEEDIKKQLAERNQLDLELYEYAQSLISLRLKYLIPIYNAAKAHAMEKFHKEGGPALGHLRSLTTSTHKSSHQFSPNTFECSVSIKDVRHRKSVLSSKYKGIMGVFQPPGHKGP